MAIGIMFHVILVLPNQLGSRLGTVSALNLIKVSNCDFLERGNPRMLTNCQVILLTFLPPFDNVMGGFDKGLNGITDALVVVVIRVGKLVQAEVVQRQPLLLISMQGTRVPVDNKFLSLISTRS